MALIANVVKGSASNRLALLVHGLGADERDLGGLLTYLDPDGVLAAVLPRAPYPLPGTPGYAWYGMFAGDDVPGTYGDALAELTTCCRNRPKRCAPARRGDCRRILPGRRTRPRPRCSAASAPARRPRSR
jgi:hypothetical protein